MYSTVLRWSLAIWSRMAVGLSSVKDQSSWHLSESLCFAILHHHDLLYSNEILALAEADAVRLIAAGLVAEQLYCLATRETCREWAPAGEWALFELDLTQERFAAIVARVNTSINHL